MVKKKTATIITGVIGADCHVVGNTLLNYALRNAGFNLVSLGTCVSQEEFINAAIETKADAILISSLYGHGMLDCAGFGAKCKEAGLSNVLLYIGGNLEVGERPWEEVKKEFEKQGFNRVYPQYTAPTEAIKDLKADLGIID